MCTQDCLKGYTINLTQVCARENILTFLDGSLSSGQKRQKSIHHIEMVICIDKMSVFVCERELKQHEGWNPIIIELLH